MYISAYHAIPKMNDDLMGNKLKGALIDNYVLTHYSDFVEKNDVRIETTFEHAITYGLSLRANASSDMVNCFRRYVRNHPQEAFEIIAKNLKPLKVMVTYSFHLYSRSSHNFVLCFIPFTG